MEFETINKLFLELSQITTARTEIELMLEGKIKTVKEQAVREVMDILKKEVDKDHNDIFDLLDRFEESVNTHFNLIVDVDGCGILGDD